MTYTVEDCKKDTNEHIDKVEHHLDRFAKKLYYRSAVHDQSKLNEPELSIFTKYTPLLKETTYGSDAYHEHLKGMQVALDHHYQSNSHHPEHFENGINDMNLIDIVEMLCDWKAASERHGDGDIRKSLDINRKRFNINDQLYGVLLNTINEMGW